jgi:hypothetical protein
VKEALAHEASYCTSGVLGSAARAHNSKSGGGSSLANLGVCCSGPSLCGPSGCGGAGCEGRAGGRGANTAGRCCVGALLKRGRCCASAADTACVVPPPMVLSTDSNCAAKANRYFGRRAGVR